MFILPKDTEMTPKLLGGLISEHQSEVTNRYKGLRDTYESKHAILVRNKKADHKPDNRLVANFAKYIVDTFNGYFIGNPIRVTHDNENVNNYLELLDSYNNQDDNNAELSKLCSIFGHGYELVFTDEDAQVGITYFSPEEGFIVYDESIVRKRLFGVRYYKNTKGKIEGSFSDADKITYFYAGEKGGYTFDEPVSHYFGGVPIIEYVENEERQGAFENVMTLIDAFDKALSEKANDVDYYADAYLKILGAELDTKTLESLRDNRVISISDTSGKEVVVEFLQKPEADATQENLIDRLEKLIFQIAMVANLNDQDLGNNASGISLEWKTQNMSNLAKTKERKFTAGMNARYKLISNLPASKIPNDEWLGIKYTFTRNLPKNLLEESEIAKNLQGVTSEETQLGVLSIIDNAKEEMAKKDAEGMVQSIPTREE